MHRRLPSSFVNYLVSTSSGIFSLQLQVYLCLDGLDIIMRILSLKSSGDFSLTEHYTEHIPARCYLILGERI